MAERVPPSMNSMDVLNEYFLQFGPVTAMQINHNRHETIVTFGRVEHAEEAMKWPVLNDPTIGLRPWRSKAGQRGPHEPPPSIEGPDGALVSPLGAQANGMNVAASSEAPGAPDVTTAVVPEHGAVDGTPNDAASSYVHAVDQVKGNKHLETGKLLENKRKHGELEERRKSLLQGLTDQLKKVMAKISDPQTSEKNRDQLQVILSTIKDKITALTPKEPKPRIRVAAPASEWHLQGEEEVTQAAPSGVAGRGSPASRWPPSSWRPRGPSWAPWQNEWTLPVSDRSVVAEESAEATAPTEVPADAAIANSALQEQEHEDGYVSGAETEAMDSDIEDLELRNAFVALDQGDTQPVAPGARPVEESEPAEQPETEALADACPADAVDHPAGTGQVEGVGHDAEREDEPPPDPI